MKTSHLNSNLKVLLLCFLTLNSCDSFVDVALPKSQLTSESVFEDYATADAALTNIYAKIRDNRMLSGINSGLSNQLGNYTDELEAFGAPTSATLNFYNNTLLPSNANIAEYWNTAYNQIYAANAVMEGIEKTNAISIENKKTLQGEALFIRALLHMYLVNLFGDVPYITKTNYLENSVATRMSTVEVYQNLIKDLNNASELLKTTYSNTERVRPNRYTAKALLARVYLYSGAYDEAANEASSLLNLTNTFALVQNSNQVFLNTSKETIWQLKSAAAGQNTKEAETFIFLSGPPSLTALSNNFVNSFELGDARKANWIKAVTDGTTTWYHPYKYKQQNFSSSSVEYSIMFRLAEQYLIRAEARARAGDLIGAKEDINKIRQRSGLSNTTAGSKEEILDAVLQERKWELFTENGHRFFDLKRFDKIDTVLSSVKQGWNSTDSLFPIPQNELSTNTHLNPQNPGY
ncbi:RagB/SusD family nutrient uptake outer membrane protein [Flavobacterium sp. TAB 87]|uniref:RagB/SusD family nutrient uptake outer membrane protein n=1 Tax=Flavobacterium sp. TAB 87 TaxID=1729581 RepID=UPI00076CF06A|nr:RagB/SusD family nutrient uptake outer membrane protein [Flavobacterium sp. TAB 87]KVV16222.1 SusD family protein [Flavobacterium sp. TAB 87]